MFSTPVNLINVESSQDLSTGKRIKQISTKELVYADVQEVGLNEFYSSQSIHINISKVLEIPKHRYNNQRFVIMEDGTQYEIYRVAKGRNMGFVRLILQDCKPQDIVEVDS